MLYIICAEQKEADQIKIQNKNVRIVVTGVGLYNILKSPRLNLYFDDIILNVGYAGSNIFKTGEVYSVSSCERYKKSNIVNEKKQFLFPYYFLGAECYTSDDFIESTMDDLPLVDMELYYLSLMYPKIRSIKIVSDNLSIDEYNDAIYQNSWQRVNTAIEDLVYGK